MGAPETGQGPAREFAAPPRSAQRLTRGIFFGVPVAHEAYLARHCALGFRALGGQRTLLALVFLWPSFLAFKGRRQPDIPVDEVRVSVDFCLGRKWEVEVCVLILPSSRGQERVHETVNVHPGSHGSRTRVRAWIRLKNHAQAVARVLASVLDFAEVNLKEP